MDGTRDGLASTRGGRLDFGGFGDGLSFVSSSCGLSSAISELGAVKFLTPADSSSGLLSPSSFGLLTLAFSALLVTSSPSILSKTRMD